MFGLKKQLAPVVADAQETLATVRDQMNLMVAVVVAVLAVSLLTLAAVLGG